MSNRAESLSIFNTECIHQLTTQSHQNSFVMRLYLVEFPIPRTSLCITGLRMNTTLPEPSSIGLPLQRAGFTQRHNKIGIRLKCGFLYEYTVRFESNGTSSNRDTTLAQIAVLDDCVSDVVGALKDNGLWDDTLLVLSSDNGAAYSYGDTFPLRGFKNSSFEGGVRVPTFVSGGHLDQQRRGYLSPSFSVDADFLWIRCCLAL